MGAWKSVLKDDMQRSNMELQENNMFRKLFRWTMSFAIDSWCHYIKQMNIAEVSCQDFDFPHNLLFMASMALMLTISS